MDKIEYKSGDRVEAGSYNPPAIGTIIFVHPPTKNDSRRSYEIRFEGTGILAGTYTQRMFYESDIKPVEKESKSEEMILKDQIKSLVDNRKFNVNDQVTVAGYNDDSVGTVVAVNSRAANRRGDEEPYLTYQVRFEGRDVFEGTHAIRTFREDALKKFEKSKVNNEQPTGDRKKIFRNNDKVRVTNGDISYEGVIVGWIEYPNEILYKIRVKETRNNCEVSYINIAMAHKIELIETAEKIKVMDDDYSDVKTEENNSSTFDARLTVGKMVCRRIFKTQDSFTVSDFAKELANTAARWGYGEIVKVLQRLSADDFLEYSVQKFKFVPGKDYFPKTEEPVKEKEEEKPKSIQDIADEMISGVLKALDNPEVKAFTNWISKIK